jgi:hypothetical protein
VSDKVLFLLLTGAVVGAVIGLLALMVRASRNNARRPPWVSAAGWAMLFLSSGRMPPPPPASQIELDMNGEKDRLASRSIDPD